jgi:hypothetical protein
LKFFGDWDGLHKGTAVVGIESECIAAVDLTEVRLQQLDDSWQ